MTTLDDQIDRDIARGCNCGTPESMGGADCPVHDAPPAALNAGADGPCPTCGAVTESERAYCPSLHGPGSDSSRQTAVDSECAIRETYTHADLLAWGCAARKAAIEEAAKVAVAHGEYFAEAGRASPAERITIVGAARGIASSIRALLKGPHDV